MSWNTNKRSLFQKLIEEVTWLDSKYIHPLFYRRLIKELPFPEFDKRNKIIDVGCGAGWICRQLAKMVPEGEVVGLDISERYINKLKESLEKDKLAPKNLVFRLGRAENIPYPDNYFDYAVSFGSFFLWSEPEEGLTEIRRVLKPRGRAYIIDVYKEGPASYRISAQLFFNLCSAYKPHFYSFRKFKEFLESAGFTEVYQKEIMNILLTVGTKE